ncbi:MAG: Gfo/Idh/MocA family oxidoreductase [Planctomycetota bacterium]
MKKRYVLAGCGGRGLGMFGKPLTFDKELAPHSEVVALYDASPARMEFTRRELNKVPGFPMFTDWDALARQVDFDGLVVATVDRTHADLIVKGLKLGKRVFCEKPVCVTPAQVRAILAAEKRSKGTVFVTHNMRYSPAFMHIKKLIDGGLIGRLIFAEFNDFLDRHHGADYFRRWHGVKKNSGGLAIHKSSHHFDLLQFIVGSRGRTLSAMGATSFYGKNGPYRGKRCRGCAHARKCAFYADLFNNDEMKGMYQAAEADSGYLRDGCVYRREITTEDNFHCVFEYENGVHGSYALTAFCPFEGYRVVFEGTKGRLEYTAIGSADWAPGHNATPGLAATAGEHLRAFIVREGIRDIPIPKVAGGHGGADPALRRDFFVRSWKMKKRTPQMATLMEGCQAVLMGAATNIAMATGRVVAVQSLLKKG